MRPGQHAGHEARASAAAGFHARAGAVDDGYAADPAGTGPHQGRQHQIGCGKAARDIGRAEREVDVPPQPGRVQDEIQSPPRQAGQQADLATGAAELVERRNRARQGLNHDPAERIS